MTPRRIYLTLASFACISIVALLSVPLLAGGGVTVIDPDGSILISDRGAYLGVQLEEETDDPEGGARITRIVGDSPADEAGLRVGDIIVRFDGHTIRGPASLTKRIHEREAGDRVELTIIRKGRRKEIDVEMGTRKTAVRRFGDYTFVTPERAEAWGQRMQELGERLGERFSYSYSCDDSDCTYSVSPGLTCDDDENRCSGQHSLWSNVGSRRAKLGVQLVEVTPELREHMGSDRQTGVLVSKIVAGSAAEQAGIEVGDLIISIAGADVSNTSGIRRELRGKVGETFDVEVIRNGRRRSISVTIPEPENDFPTGPRAMLRPFVAPTPIVDPAPKVCPTPRPVMVAPAPPLPGAAPHYRLPREPRVPRVPRVPRRPVTAPTPTLPQAPIAPTPPALPVLSTTNVV